MPEDKCWLCLRTSPRKVLEASHKLFPYSPEVARKIGLKAAELLRQAYLKNPPALCGRKTDSLIAAALYITCLEENQHKTQFEISMYAGLDVVQETLRANYKHLAKMLGIWSSS